VLITVVRVVVKEDRVDDFKHATRENAQKSREEPGIARFDVLQQKDDPRRFILVEAYRTADDPARHKETAHYKTWRTAVEEMMAEPRTSVQYENTSPDDADF